MIKKTRIGAKIHKQYDKPLTPYQRLMMDERVGLAAKEALRHEHECIDILALMAALDQELECLISLATLYPWSFFKAFSLFARRDMESLV